MRRVLDEAKVPKAGVTLALPRAEFVVRTSEYDLGDRAEGSLAPLIAMRLEREYPEPGTPLTCDFSSTDRAGEHVWITAAAMPSSRVAWWVQVLKTAGRPARSLRIRTDCLTAFVADEQPTLVTYPGVHATEFAVVAHGSVQFSRSTPGSLAGKPLQIEADRTIASLRTTKPGLQVASHVVVADDSHEVPEAFQRVQAPIDLPGHEDSAVTDMSLLGFASEPSRSHRLDLLQPQTPPDTGAAARQRVMLVALLLIAIVGSAFVFGRMKTEDLQRELDLATAARNEASKSYIDALADEATFRHQAAWASARFDWAAHLQRTIETLPEPGRVVLDQIQLRGDTEIRFNPGGDVALPGSWNSRQIVRLDLSGKSTDRESIEALREALLPLGTLTSRGADTENAFDLELLSTEPRPDLSEAAE